METLHGHTFLVKSMIKSNINNQVYFIHCDDMIRSIDEDLGWISNRLYNMKGSIPPILFFFVN